MLVSGHNSVEVIHHPQNPFLQLSQIDESMFVLPDVECNRKRFTAVFTFVFLVIMMFCSDVEFHRQAAIESVEAGGCQLTLITGKTEFLIGVCRITSLPLSLIFIDSAYLSKFLFQNNLRNSVFRYYLQSCTGFANICGS